MKCDYNEGHLLEAIEVFRNRERRYGGREDCAPYQPDADQ